MALKTFGLMAVDWEERVNIERLRQDRLSRIKAAPRRPGTGWGGGRRPRPSRLAECSR